MCLNVFFVLSFTVNSHVPHWRDWSSLLGWTRHGQGLQEGYRSRDPQLDEGANKEPIAISRPQLELTSARSCTKPSDCKAGAPAGHRCHESQNSPIAFYLRQGMHQRHSAMLRSESKRSSPASIVSDASGYYKIQPQSPGPDTQRQLQSVSMLQACQAP